LGLLGCGAIGQAIARRALAFDMRIVAKVRQHRLSPMAGVELVASLDQVLGEADHLVLALPVTAESRGLLDAEPLALIKPGVHLVSVARSGLIDQDALRPLLDRGHIATASLDVVDPEPLLAGHWLYTHPACVSVPIFPGAHRAWWSGCRAFFCAIRGLLPTGDGWREWRMWQPVIEGGGTRLP
jgi:phosphoglycerate dehydrogenase-like enzyme